MYHVLSCENKDLMSHKPVVSPKRFYNQCPYMKPEYDMFPHKLQLCVKLFIKCNVTCNPASYKCKGYVLCTAIDSHNKVVVKSLCYDFNES